MHDLQFYRAGELLCPTRRHSAPITDVASFEDLYISTGYDGLANMWRLGEASPIWTYQAPDLLNFAEFDQTGERVAIACADGRVYILDVQSGLSISTVGPFGDDVQCCKWLTPDDLIIACNFFDTKIYIFDVRAMRMSAELIGHTGCVTDIAIGPNGEKFASAAEDGTIRIWDCNENECVHVLNPGADCETVAWSGDVILAGGNDGQARFWNADTLELLESLEFEGAVRKVLLWGDGSCFALGIYGGYLHFGNVLPFEVKRTYRHRYQWERGISISNTKLIVGSFGDAPIVYETSSSDTAPLFPVGATNGINAVVSGACTVFVSDNGSVSDADSGAAICQHSSIANTAAFSTSGVLASGDYRGIVILTDPSSRRQEERPISKGPVNSIAWLDDNRLFCAGYDTKIYELDDKLSVRGVIEHHSSPVKALFAFPTINRLVSGSSDGKIAIWEGANLVAECIDESMMLVNGLSGSLELGLFCSASRDGHLRIWSVEDGTLVHKVETPHAKSCRCVAMSPNGSIIATGSYDGNVAMWRPRRSIWMHSSHTNIGKPGVSSLAWRDNGTLLAAGWNGRVVEFDADNGSVLRANWLPSQINKVS